jgi:hypothetical protein
LIRMTVPHAIKSKAGPIPRRDAAPRASMAALAPTRSVVTAMDAVCAAVVDPADEASPVIMERTTGHDQTPIQAGRYTHQSISVAFSVGAPVSTGWLARSGSGTHCARRGVE